MLMGRSRQGIPILPILLLLSAPSTIANIIFNWIQPTCNPWNAGSRGSCLRGQTCHADGQCRSTAYSGLVPLSKRDYSADGRCGPAYGDSLCDPESSVYHGTCCSMYGWCGNTSDHCGTGCTSGCTVSGGADSQAATNTSDTDVSPTLTIGEPTVGQSLSTPLGNSETLPSTGPTADGSCGAAAGGSVCGDWYRGGCCSMYGFCGNTTAHCGEGCQSGPCTGSTNIATVPGPSAAPLDPNPGSFTVVGQSGVPPMHAGLMENGRVFFLDKVENYTQLSLASGQFAYSAEYDPETNEVVPLAYMTNAFCSGGIFLADGQVMNVGGNGPLDSVDPTVGDGFTAIRYLNRSSTDPSLDGQNWSEPGNKLSSARWYASAQIMQDGTVFVASGSLNGFDPAASANNNPTFEILDANGISSGQAIVMDILEKSQPYYMYPFMHLLYDGSLFVFVSKSAELFNVSSGVTIRTFPDLAGDYRTYPNSGGSVILPFSSANSWQPEIVICGGGPYQALSAPTDASCGKIQPLAESPEWEMDGMPEGRVMVEGVLLPDGKVVWLNGGSQGAQGFGLAGGPAYEALIYDPVQPLGQRFTSGANSTIPRLYHSVALLLLDGTIMVAGSNPVEQPVLTPDAQNPYVTEFRVEIYTPPYLSGDNANRRPTNISLSSTALTSNGSQFSVSFTAPDSSHSATVVLYYGGFVTHSLHMGHRMAILDTSGWADGASEQTLQVTMPPNRNVAPPGPYVVYVLCDGVPGIGQFVRVS